MGVWTLGMKPLSMAIPINSEVTLFVADAMS